MPVMTSIISNENGMPHHVLFTSSMVGNERKSMTRMAHCMFARHILQKMYAFPL